MILFIDLKEKRLVNKGKKMTVVYILLVSVLVASSISSIASSSSKYAYSVGVNGSYSGSSNPGDFTSNVQYASDCYGLISGFTSYRNYTPSSSYLKGNNSVGNKRIASDIVFLNGHGNNELMVFHYKKSDTVYKVGVRQGEDWTSSSTGYIYTGLASSVVRLLKELAT